MIMDTLEVSILIPVSCNLLYDAFLNSQVHSAFTNSPAVINNRPGGSYSAYNGYISGVILSLDPGRRIIETWRTTDFHDDDEDTILQIDFIPEQELTRVVLTQTNLPEGTADGYKQGWIEYYLVPLKDYFNPRNDK